MPTPGSPPTSTSDAGTRPPPSTRSSSERRSVSARRRTPRRRRAAGADEQRPPPLRRAGAPRPASRTIRSRAFSEPARRRVPALGACVEDGCLGHQASLGAGPDAALCRLCAETALPAVTSKVASPTGSACWRRSTTTCKSLASHSRGRSSGRAPTAVGGCDERREPDGAIHSATSGARRRAGATVTADPGSPDVGDSVNPSLHRHHATACDAARAPGQRRASRADPHQKILRRGAGAPTAAAAPREQREGRVGGRARQLVRAADRPRGTGRPPPVALSAPASRAMHRRSAACPRASPGSPVAAPAGAGRRRRAAACSSGRALSASGRARNLGEVEVGSPRFRARRSSAATKNWWTTSKTGRPSAIRSPRAGGRGCRPRRRACPRTGAGRGRALPRIEVEPDAGDDVERRRLERIQHAAEIRAALEDHVVVADEDVRRLDVAQPEIAAAGGAGEL